MGRWDFFFETDICLCWAVGGFWGCGGVKEEGGGGGGWLRGRGEGYGMEEGLGSWSLCLYRVGLQLRESVL